MSKIKIGDQYYAAGLSWTPLPGKKIAAELANLADDTNKYFGFKKEIAEDANDDQETKVKSYFAGLTDKKETKGLISCAAILSDLETDILLIEKINDSDYWICAITNHEILAGGDIVTKKENVKSQIEEIFASFDTLADVLRIFISEEASAETEVEGDEFTSFLQILSNNNIDKPSKQFAKYTVNSLKGIPKAAFLFAGFSAACGVLAYIMVGVQKDDYVIEPVAPEENIQAIIQQPVNSEESILKEAYEEEVRWLTDEFIENNAYSTIIQVVNFTYTIPNSMGGWRSQNISYDNKIPETVSIRWEKEQSGTTITLKAVVGDNGMVSFDLSGQFATSQHLAVRPTKKEIGNNILDFIRNEKYKHTELMHDAQALNLNLSLTNNSATDRPIPIAGINDQRKATERQLNVRSKSFTISGSGREDLVNVATIMNHAKTSLIRSISIDNTDYRNLWTVTGVIYEN